MVSLRRKVIKARRHYLKTISGFNPYLGYGGTGEPSLPTKGILALKKSLKAKNSLDHFKNRLRGKE